MNCLTKWLKARRRPKAAEYSGAPPGAEWEHAWNWSGHWVRCRLSDGRVGSATGLTRCVAQARAHEAAEQDTRK